MALDLLEELWTLADSLEKRGLPYAVCGGLALAIHGLPRATKDLDLLVGESDLRAIEKIAFSQGFTLSSGILPFDSGKPAERRILRLSKVDGEDFLTLDLMIVTPILESAWEGRVRVTIGGRQIQVVSREGLIAMKRLANRPIDISDIEKLEGPR